MPETIEENNVAAVTHTEAELANAASELKKKTEAQSDLPPILALRELAEGLSKEKHSLMMTYGQELLDEFATEGTSRIAIGRTLNKAHDDLGELWPKFRTDFVEKKLRKSTAAIYQYMALAQAAAYTFDAASQPAKTALFRIWGAEGCFDVENGKLKPLVNDAINASGGLCRSKEQLECEQWAQRFVNVCDTIVRIERAKTAEVNRVARQQEDEKAWDAETVKDKTNSLVAAFRAFITHNGVESKDAEYALARILAEAMVEMSHTAIESASKRANDIYKRMVAELNAKKQATKQQARDGQLEKEAAKTIAVTTPAA